MEVQKRMPLSNLDNQIILILSCWVVARKFSHSGVHWELDIKGQWTTDKGIWVYVPASVAEQYDSIFTFRT